MRTMEINKQTFYYCPYVGSEMQEDEYGNLTGENAPSYGEATPLKGNISEASGRTSTEMFGVHLEYDKVIVMDDCPLTELDVLFVDKEPEFDGDTPKYDYIVKLVSKSLNHTAIAIKKVDTK